jgi:hypothetical protein
MVQESFAALGFVRFGKDAVGLVDGGKRQMEILRWLLRHNGLNIDPIE